MLVDAGKLRKLIKFCSVLALSVLCVQARAACIDDGIDAFAADPRAIELCESEHCEIALLTRSCGNVHYLASEFETDTNRWLFRVRFHEEGSDDDEYFVIRNGAEVSFLDLQNMSCNPLLADDEDCDFVSRVLTKTPVE